MQSTAWIIAGTILSASGLASAGPDGQAIVDRAAALYRDASTYTDVANVTFEMNAAGANGEDMSHVFEQQTRLAFERPGRLLLQGEEDAVRCDGTTLWTTLGCIQQYTRKDAPERLTFHELAGEAMLPDHPLLQTLLPTDERAPAFGFLEQITGAEPMTLDGQAGTLVRGTGQVLWAPGPVNTEAWFNDATGLLGSVTIDLTDTYKEMMGITDEPIDQAADEGDDMMMHAPASIESTRLTMRLETVAINKPIAASTFAYTPEDGFEEVDSFSFDGMMMGGHDDQQELVGEMAPQIAGKALDGSAFDLHAMRGRVVVLDFWATWCGPCVAAIPQMQTLSEQYDDAEVSIVGINLDDLNTKKVQRFVDDKQLTFAQYLDDGTVSDEYGVQGIPCIVLIGKSGRIESVHVGVAPDTKAQLKTEIDRLLKGESLARAVPTDGL